MMTERILDLTLEVNYLLTGEDYIVVKRSSEPDLRGSSPHASDVPCRTQSPGRKTSPHSLIHEKNNDQKILEMTNKIIHLLTGEVWKYLHGPKDPHDEVMETPSDHGSQNILDFWPRSSFPRTVLTMTNKNRYQKTEKILDLTLEVNYLLTGEDYVVVMRSGESRLQSGTSHRTQKPSTEPPPCSTIHEKHNKQKILELTNTIIHLLTGEVLAYLQGYKELYQDIITETLQPHHVLDGSLNRPEDDVLNSHVPSPNQGRNDGIMNKPREGTGEFISSEKSLYTDSNILDVQPSTYLPEESDDNVYPCADYIKEYPSTFTKVDQTSSREGNLSDTSEYTPIKYIFAHQKAESSSCGEENPRNDMYLPVGEQVTYRERKEDPASQEDEDGNLISGKGYPHTEQTHYQSPHIKEESGSCGGGKLETELYPPTERRRTKRLSTCINEEPALCGGGDLLDTDLYPPTQHTPLGFPPTDLEEPSSCEMENRPGTDMCIVSGHLQRGYLYPSTDIKEESTSNEEESLSNTDIFPAAEQTQTEYLTTCIKEELATYDKENLTNLHRKPTEYLYARIEEEPVSRGNLPGQNVQIQRLSGILSSGNIIAPEISTIWSDLPGFKSCPIRPNEISQGGEMSWTCSECGKGFHLETELMLHHKIHTGEKTYGSNEPEKLPGQILDPRGPLGAQTKEKPYSCSACGKCFGHVADLCKHQVVHVRAQSFPCSECRKLFSSKSNLNAHLRFHVGKRQVSYSELGKYLGKQSSLHKHQTVNGKSFACSECGKVFTSKSNLNTHQRIHTGVKLFSCSECEKCFTDGANLSHHQLTHTGEKPFSCSVCGKRFGRKFSLTRHQRVHMEQKAFSSP